MSMRYAPAHGGLALERQAFFLLDEWYEPYVNHYGGKKVFAGGAYDEGY